MIDLQPTLSGKLVKVSPLRQSHKQELYAVASDPRIWKQHPSGRYQEEEFNQFFSESIDSGGALLITESKTESIIGATRYCGYDRRESRIEIGWTFLAKSCWGGKYNAELKRLMLSHAFKSVNSVFFYIDSNNKRSQAAVQKIGGIQVQDKDALGRIVFRIAKSEFLNRD